MEPERVSFKSKLASQDVACRVSPGWALGTRTPARHPGPLGMFEVISPQQPRASSEPCWFHAVPQWQWSLGCFSPAVACRRISHLPNMLQLLQCSGRQLERKIWMLSPTRGARAEQPRYPSPVANPLGSLRYGLRNLPSGHSLKITRAADNGQAVIIKVSIADNPDALQRDGHPHVLDIERGGHICQLSIGSHRSCTKVAPQLLTWCLKAGDSDLSSGPKNMNPKQHSTTRKSQEACKLMQKMAKLHTKLETLNVMPAFSCVTLQWASVGFATESPFAQMTSE